MYLLMVVIFVFGYLGIALEHNIKVDKAASALLTGVLTWTIFVFGASDVLNVDYSWSISEFIANSGDYVKGLKNYALGLSDASIGADENVKSLTNHFIIHELEHHLIEISEILFFLIGAMTIVEVIDVHGGFSVITDRIKTTKKVKLIWILSILTFFFSAALDNLTTAIVMAALLKKLIADKKDLWLFAGVIIIAANAGGAWSPIGDVTTIMLWIGGQITAGNIIATLILPSLVTLLVPLGILSFTMKGNITRPDDSNGIDKDLTTKSERNLVFILGVACLLQVPIFKTVTHMPPFMGVLLGLGILWLVTEILHKNKSHKDKTQLSVVNTLRKIDTPSVLFFLGILVAVASLQSAGHLIDLAGILESSVGNLYIINVIIGLLSSIVDNVPLVAAAMGMYEIGPEVAGISYPVDHVFWEFLAYCAGTGGSCLIIGSAAGVAVMGILKIDFVWYLRKISFLALVGYLAGAGVFYILAQTLYTH
ncbi:MAG: sodium:proton antiporter NhaD [Salibacter sp.]|uniref:sodium:proton antiporter NhaD n=1 Tax=Salibacter sp. TaxID=2010995 RepID=UPI0028709780|nr:sodium:proton antiporter NhaD [Salibacter sp.]MDR9398257.1 sodium:proton antiporter NhaD [Salibacter sp.]